MHRLKPNLALGTLVAAISVASTAGAAACDTNLLEGLKGEYVGQQAGWRSSMNVTAVDSGACSIQSDWTTRRADDEEVTGKMTMTLSNEETTGADGVLTGKWDSGGNQGKARFVVRRKGQHLNGRIMGLENQPAGPWDFIKIVPKDQAGN